jgi:PAS domain S-box-containing protein
LLSKNKEKISFNVSASALRWRKDFIGIVFVARDMRKTNEIIKDLREKTESLTKTETKLQGVINDMEKNKKNLEDQRLATLNILDDAHQSQAELEVANQALAKKSQELLTLKTLGDELTKVLDIEKAVQAVNKHLVEVLKFSAVTYLVINPAEEGGLIYQVFLKEEVSELFVDEAEKDLFKFLSREKDDKMEAALKVVKNIKPRFFGQKLNNKSTARPKAKVILPLSIGTRKLGVIFITSAKSGLSNIKKGGLIDTMILTFVLAIDRLHTLISAQHSKTVSLVESLSDGVVMFNNEGETVLKNPAFIKYTGLTAKEFVLDDFYKLFAGIDAGRMVNEALTLGKVSHIHEAAVGEKFYEIFITPVKDNQAKIVGGAIILHDITHLKEVDKMKTEFVSVASHQLRTPLTAIKLFTGMLARGEVGELNKEQKEYLDNIQQSIERMVRLVNDLLNVTRIESGKLRVEPQLLDVVSFIKNIIAEAKPLAEIKKQKILFKQGDAALPKVLLDQNLMRQVIHNLIINAIHYSPQDKGKIIISLDKKDKDNFIISIKDNGIGISKEAKGRIFEKFYRADNAVKMLTAGTGLGLYVAQKIVESARGKIWFKSKKNKGSTFFVQMPIVGMKKKEEERGLVIS